VEMKVECGTVAEKVEKAAEKARSREAIHLR
jgi:hypothetical protein